jgi:manganese/iron transport system permease protein
VYLSFFLDSASAPTIVLLLTIAFIAAFLRSSRQPTGDPVPAGRTATT